MAVEVIESCVEQASRLLGYSYLKEEQKKIITEFMRGNDVFGVLPTGFGKSLCFHCLPKAFDLLKGTHGSIAVVVTPLIAIMEDMTKFLSSRGLTVAHISQIMKSGRAS